MIKYCCYYCQKFKEDTCENPICYNAFAHPKNIREGVWYCQQYEGNECGETITNNGLMKVAQSKCWESKDV